MNSPTYISGVLQTKAYRVLRLRVNEALSEYGLSVPEWSLIGQIWANKDGIRLSEVAVLLDVEAPLVTVLVDQLVKKELVVRHDHPQDKRAKLLFLTKPGMKLVPEVEEKLTTMLKKIFHGLTQDDMKIYEKVLLTIIANAETI